jgi:HAD superfamily hydrolase (TIGR01544 family)
MAVPSSVSESLPVGGVDVTDLFDLSCGRSCGHPFKALTVSREALERKLGVFVADGIERLKVVTDFDFTLTKFQVPARHSHGAGEGDDGVSNGVKTYNRGMSCHKVLEYSGFMSVDRLQQAKDLHSLYYPIEIDPHVPLPEKCQHMVDWCTKAHELIIASGFSRGVIENSVSTALTNDTLGFREHSDEFFRLLKGMNVPILVFSAGIADVLEVALLHLLSVENLASSYSNVYVLSNRCIFEGGLIKNSCAIQRIVLTMTRYCRRS